MNYSRSCIIMCIRSHLYGLWHDLKVLTNKRSVCLSIATTARPKFNSLLVMAMPMPPLAPVTNATFPFHRFMSVVILSNETKQKTPKKSEKITKIVIEIFVFRAHKHVYIIMYHGIYYNIIYIQFNHGTLD